MPSNNIVFVRPMSVRPNLFFITDVRIQFTTAKIINFTSSNLSIHFIYVPEITRKQ